MQEEGPVIHELAHDDILHNDATQDSMNATNFGNNLSPGTSSRSPIDPSTSIQYQVTMEDGDDVDTGIYLLFG